MAKAKVELTQENIGLVLEAIAHVRRDYPNSKELDELVAGILEDTSEEMLYLLNAETGNGLIEQCVVRYLKQMRAGQL
jgi:hypothetical protein